MRRRTFLVAGGSVALLAGAGLVVQREGWLRPSFKALRERHHLRLGDGAWAVISELHGTDAIAQSWLSQSGNGTADVAALENGLIDRLKLDTNLAIAAGPFAQALSEAIRSDFRERHLGNVDGWLVSETECRVAALRLKVLGKGAEPGPVRYTDGTIVRVKKWGPRETQQDTPVNVQQDGHSGIWIVASGAPSWVKFEIDGSRVSTNVSEDVITTGLYGALQDRILAKAGKYPAFLVDEMAHVRQRIGEFTVTPRAERVVRGDGTRSELFCPISNWGPRQIVAGKPGNPQPDGADGIWIKTACAPATAHIVFDGTELATTIRKDLVTARVPASMISQARTVKLELRDGKTGERLIVGDFVIKPH